MPCHARTVPRCVLCVCSSSDDWPWWPKQHTLRLWSLNSLTLCPGSAFEQTQCDRKALVMSDMKHNFVCPSISFFQSTNYLHFVCFFFLFVFFAGSKSQISSREIHDCMQCIAHTMHTMLEFLCVRCTDRCIYRLFQRVQMQRHSAWPFACGLSHSHITKSQCSAQSKQTTHAHRIYRTHTDDGVRYCSQAKADTIFPTSFIIGFWFRRHFATILSNGINGIIISDGEGEAATKPTINTSALWHVWHMSY